MQPTPLKRRSGQPSRPSRLSLREQLGDLGYDELDSEDPEKPPAKRLRTSLDAPTTGSGKQTSHQQRPNQSRAAKTARATTTSAPATVRANTAKQLPRRQTRKSASAVQQREPEPERNGPANKKKRALLRPQTANGEAPAPPTLVDQAARPGSTHPRNRGRRQAKTLSAKAQPPSTTVPRAMRASRRGVTETPSNKTTVAPSKRPAAQASLGKRRRRHGSPAPSESAASQPSSSADPEDLSDGPGPGPRVRRKPYLCITARTRHVPRKIIEAEWTPLAPTSIASVAALLNLAERPVVARLSSRGSRRQHAASAIRAVSRRVAGKLTRGLPFPSSTTTARPKSSVPSHHRDTELDFERILDGVRALERRLDPLVHSIDLLDAERRRLQRHLDADRHHLQQLQSNSRRELRELCDSLRRRAHPLLPLPGPPEPVGFATNSEHGSLFEVKSRTLLPTFGFCCIFFSFC